MKNLFLHSDQLEQFPYPETCPFNTSRAAKTRKTLQSMGLYTGADKEEVCPDAASEQQLRQFHDPKYIDILKRASNGEFEVQWLSHGLGTGDCPVFKGVYEYNALACGATICGAQAILDRGADSAFNPSGGLHHAFPAKAAGFCYLNDVVLGCMTLAGAGKKVMFIDIDVHHSDGVEYAFYDRDDVMVVSIHETGKHLFPGTGRVEDIGTGAGKGYTVNVPLVPGTYDQIYIEMFKQIVLPLAHSYEPEIFVLEIGADTLAGDPLAHLSLTNNVYVEVINQIKAFGKPILATGGGGYNVDNTVRAWALCWTTLCGDNPDQDMMAGMGGVMLESTEWQDGQGLCDRVLVPDQQQRELVDPEMESVIKDIKTLVFPLHGL